jgi:hypothetical protein
LGSFGSLSFSPCKGFDEALSFILESHSAASSARFGLDQPKSLVSGEPYSRRWRKQHFKVRDLFHSISIASMTSKEHDAAAPGFVKAKAEAKANAEKVIRSQVFGFLRSKLIAPEIHNL